jgi:hypothetical protein
MNKSRIRIFLRNRRYKFAGNLKPMSWSAVHIFTNLLINLNDIKLKYL